MDGPRNHGYGTRSGYDIRTRCVCGCTERRQGLSPGQAASAPWGRERPAVATAASCSTGGSCLCCSAMADLLQNDLNHLTGKKRINLNMKAEHTIDKPARAGRATQIAAMVITGLVAFIWVYFGWLYIAKGCALENRGRGSWKSDGGYG